MIKAVKRRTGEIVPFVKDKIYKAILRAGLATKEFNEETAEQLTMKVVNLILQLHDEQIITIEQVQDIVEEILLSSTFKKTAKSYIIYRDQHAKIREIVSKANVDLIDQYLKKLDWQVNENSNMSYSLQGLNNYIASEVSKTYWLNKIYPSEIKEAHLDGSVHIHDLGLLSVYCVGWDLYNLIRVGFTGAVGKIESGPAKHFRSALGQIVNFFYTLQGEAAGAQAFSSFDTLLAPFIRYDNLEYKDVKQAMQEFIFNINVPTRVGFQTPFTNITMDLHAPKIYKDQNVVIGGELMPETYGEFSKEMIMINKAFLEIMTEGDAKGRVFSFPIPTYNITKDFDWENKDLDLLWEATGKYGIPYFSNFVNSDMSPEDSRSMCCRLRLDTRKLAARGGGLFGANPLTGSIGVVTVNLPRIGYMAQTKDEFYDRLTSAMDISKRSLEIKRKVLESFTDSNLYPYTSFYLKEIKQRFDKYWKNHFSTIGLIGMNEACLNFIGRDIASEEGSAFAIEVMDFMRERLIAYQEETGNNYNLEATPAEGTTYRLAQIDRKKFPDIIVANNDPKTKKPFYTNSTQLPVNYTDDVFEALDLQDPLQTKYTGGTVLHMFGGEKISNPDSVKNLVRKVCENYRLPYFTFSPTFSICPVHGYLNGEQARCPKCLADTEIYSRIVGYLRPIAQWNDGKQEEYKMRKTFKL